MSATTTLPHATAPSVRELYSPAQLEKREDFRRETRVERGAVNVEKRTVKLSFSSETPVMRCDMRGNAFWEVLDHAHVDRSRIEKNAPLLYGHDRRDHLGTVDSVSFDADRVGRAVVRFSRSNFAQEKLRDVEDGILTCSSVGYDLANAEIVGDGQREGIPVYRFRNWQPYEVTLTPLPADPHVGVGRQASTNNQKSRITVNHNSTQSVDSTGYNADNVTDAPAILAATDVLASRHKNHADSIHRAAREFIRAGRSLGALQEHVLNSIIGTRMDIAPGRQVGADIGLETRDLRRYSLTRALSLLADNRPLDGLEREASDEVARKIERKPQGFFIPDDVLLGKRSMQTRTHTVGVPADGGYLVGETIAGEEMVNVLRSSSHVMELGGRMIPGLVGNFTIPRQLTGAIVYWVGESGTITRSNATFGQISMRPRRIGASVPYSRQLLAQSSVAVEQFVVDDINRARATELDRVAIAGTGNGQPLGILNLAASERATSVTFGGAPTFAKVCEFEANVGTANALSGRPAFLTTWGAKAKLKTTPRFTNGGVGIWNGDEDVAGYRGRACAQFPTSGTLNQMIFGNWSEVVYGEWAGVDVIVDPYTQKLEGVIEVTIQQLVDCVIRQGKSFAASSDSAAQ